VAIFPAVLTTAVTGLLQEMVVSLSKEFHHILTNYL
jgi:hypothetical protein